MNAAPIRFFPRSSAAARGGLADRFGRRLSYLRISVTDRCDLRCAYCRPEADACRPEPRERILSFEEIARIARVAAGMGVQKLRITGGEPLVRRDLPRLVARLAAIPGIRDLAMTTNATLLADHAGALARAGLMRVNVSLDSLNPLRFRQITGGDLNRVLAGIAAARAAGLAPLKLNCVLMRGINDGEMPELMDFARRIGATIRFIELMPMKRGMDWRRHYLPVSEVLEQPEVRRRIRLDAPLPGGNEAARYWPMAGAGQEGTVGFITPMSARFCEGCNRLRLTADGGLRACLPEEHKMNLRDLIRAGGSDDDIRAAFVRAAWLKPEIGVYEFDAASVPRSMIQIGG